MNIHKFMYLRQTVKTLIRYRLQQGCLLISDLGFQIIRIYIGSIYGMLVMNVLRYANGRGCALDNYPEELPSGEVSLIASIMW